MLMYLCIHVNHLFKILLGGPNYINIILTLLDMGHLLQHITRSCAIVLTLQLDTVTIPASPFEILNNVRILYKELALNIFSWTLRSPSLENLFYLIFLWDGIAKNGSVAT